MGTIGLKIKDRTYDRLKWLKTRFEFVHETAMSWDEFFDRVSRDVLLILAYDLKEKGGGKVSTDDIFSILSGYRSTDQVGDSNDFDVYSMTYREANESGDHILTSLENIKRSLEKKGMENAGKE